MKRNLGWLLGGFFVLHFCFSIKASAQVSGISYHFVPTGEYYFTHERSGIADGFAWGGQFGFGFGEYMSLSAIYLKSAGLTTDFSQLSGMPALFNEKDASLERMGGELQANLSRRRLVPFITLGTGIQGVSAEDTEKSRQIYLSAGAGLAFHLHDRINIGVQLLNTSYRINPYAVYLTPGERAGLAETEALVHTGRVSDWAVKGRVSFLLGGERTGELSEIDLAFRDQFSGGLKGLSLQLEPMVQFIDFDASIPFHDGWYAGLSAGFDLGRYIGIRGYYLHGMDEHSLGSTVPTSLWGGETRFRLNAARGLVPYLTLGGGRINALDDYQAPQGIIADNKVFASGGLGLEFPLARRLKLMAFANGLMTTMQDMADLTEPEDLVTSAAYGVKLAFSIGKKPQDAGVLLNERIESIEREHLEQQSTRLNRVVSDYEALMEEKNARLAEQQEVIDSLLVLPATVDSAEKAPSATQNRYEKSESIIRMTPDELVSVLQALRLLNTVPDTLLPVSSSGVQGAPLYEERSGARSDSSAQAESAAVATEKSIPPSGQLPEDTTAVVESLPGDATRFSGSLPDGRHRTDARAEPEVSEHQSKVIAQLDRQKPADIHGVDSTTEREDVLLAALSDQLDRMEAVMDSLGGEMDRIHDQARPEDGSSDSLLQVMMLQIARTEEAVTQLAVKLESDREKDRLLNRISRDLSATQKEVGQLSGKLESLHRGWEKNREDEKLHAKAEADQKIEADQKVKADPFLQEKHEMAVPAASASEGQMLAYKNLALFGGVSAGEVFSVNLGVRWSYQVTDSSVRLMPEAFAGFGKEADLGLTVNGLFDIELQTDKVIPYLGAGVGFMTDHADIDPFKGIVNLMIGASLPHVANGIYIDYTTRNFLRYNQISIGYTLPF